MDTCELVGGVQAPLSIVQRNTLVPWPSPVTPEVGLFGLVIVPLPLTKVQVPIAGDVATLPASVVVLVGWQKDCDGPAFATGCPGS